MLLMMTKKGPHILLIDQLTWQSQLTLLSMGTFGTLLLHCTLNIPKTAITSTQKSLRKRSLPSQCSHEAKGFSLCPK